MQQPTESTPEFRAFQFYPIEETLQQLQWFSRMRASRPVFYSEQAHCWQVFRYTEAQRVITDYQIFSSEAIPGVSVDTVLSDTIVAKDPPDHRKLRNLVNLAFTPRAVDQLTERLTQITRELLDAVL